MKGFYNSIRIKKDLVSFVAENLRLIIMTASLLLGLILGAIVIRNGWFSDSFKISELFENFVAERSSDSVFKTVLGSLSTNFIYIAAAYFAGVFAFGVPVSLALPLIKGIGVGWVCGYVYMAFGLKGVAFAMLIIIPNAFISSLVLLHACTAAFGFSKKLFGIFFKDEVCHDFKLLFSKYSVKFLIFVLAMIFSSVIDAIMSGVFIGVFGL